MTGRLKRVAARLVDSLSTIMNFDFFGLLGKTLLVVVLAVTFQFMNVYSTIVFWTSKLKSQDSSYTVTTADGTAGGERIRDYESFADVPVPGAVVSTPRLELQVFFDTNRIALGKGEENAINDFIEQLKSNVNVRRILVVGYTDTDGTAEYNASISRRRAKTVEAAFEASFPRAEITSRAAGESHPVATNSTAEGRRFNRRVEVILNGG